MVIECRKTPTQLEHTVVSTKTRIPSPLVDLVLASTPDEEPYQLLALDQTGQWKQSYTPQLVKPSNICALTRRRRSLSDLKEAAQARRFVQGAEVGAAKPSVSASTKAPGQNDVRSARKDSLVQPKKVNSINESFTDLKFPPVWSRNGLPFQKSRRNQRLDPETFSLPFGVSRP